MAVRIKFDGEYNAQRPTIILATKSGRKIKSLNTAVEHQGKFQLNAADEFSFKIYKDSITEDYWDEIKDFRLIYCIEWNKWFEISTELCEGLEGVYKNVECKALGEAELSQLNLYNVEINTETDIARDDYVVTVLYNPDNPKGSLLHRIMEKAPHYSIKYVSNSIRNIQRTFTFNGTSILDALNDIAEEIDCIVIINSGNDENGNIERSISLYDLESYCLDCHHRGEFLDNCPECGSNNILTGYGEDTTIHISSNNLAEEINYQTDVNSVKNCFRLEAGDDLMNATVRNCNPNGSSYIWYLTDEMKKDMSDELVNKLRDYDDSYNYYNSEHITNLPRELLVRYNDLVDKYNEFPDVSLSKIPTNIVGYSPLMGIYYDIIDFYLLLNNKLMPSPTLSDVNAEQQASLLTATALRNVAVSSLESASKTTVDGAVLAMAKVIVDSRFQTKIDTANSSYNESTHCWTGHFIVTNYSDEEDTATSATITITITDDYEKYCKDKIDKLLAKKTSDANDIVSLFKLDLIPFKNELKKYCLSSLRIFYDSCQGCIDILIEQGVSSEEADLYNQLYIPYRRKLEAIAQEIELRESEIGVVYGIYDEDKLLVENGIKNHIEKAITDIQDILNFENYLGTDLWFELAAYRREDTYSNNNYISDGLDNAALLKNSLEFVDVAKREIYKSATLQHSISTSLKNLLTIEEFKPIVNYFEVGNWIRITIDGKTYRLRLLDYDIDFDNLDNISVTFSDVIEMNTIVSDTKSILESAQSMSSSYGYVTRQAGQGQKSNQQLKDWISDGLSLTQVKILNSAANQNVTMDEYGILCRKYNPELETYEDEQLKIINSTIALTDNNWESTKTAVGKFYYRDMLDNGDFVQGYGINAEVVVGNIILGSQLGIYNGDNTLKFNHNGLKITGTKNEIIFTPSSDTESTSQIMTINKINGTQIFGFDTNGDLSITGTIYAGSGQVGGWTIAPSNLSHQFSERKTRMVTRVIGTITVNDLDENGEPIIDEVETVVTNYEIVVDSEGNIVYETDPTTGDVIVDEDGEPVPKTIATTTTTTELVPRTHQEDITIEEEEEYDEPINVFTTLKATGNISVALGATTLDSNNEPDPTTGQIQLFNNGVIQSTRNVIYRESLEPQIIFKRDRSNDKYAQMKMYMQDSDNGNIAFAFKPKDSTDYTYSVFMNKNGIYPYSNSGAYLGSTNYRWASLYVGYINATGTVSFGNVIQMTDSKNKKQNVITLYPYNSGENYGNSQLVIQSAGNTYIGSGESANALYRLFNKNYGNREDMYVSADSNLYLYTNCQDTSTKHAPNRKGFQFTTGGHFSPYNNGSAYLGLSAYKWKAVYATNGTIQTSDEKVKKNIKPIQHYKPLVMNTKPVEFMFTYAGADRLHYGVISQQFKEAMEAAGIDNCGAFCCDVSPEGIALGYTRETAPEKYLLYGMRYEELIAPILALVQEHENTIEEQGRIIQEQGNTIIELKNKIENI